MEDNMFVITPMEAEISLSAGETYHGTITVANPSASTSDFSFVINVSPFYIDGIDERYSEIVDWITLDETRGTLKPNETKTINYTIKVPIMVKAGAQYAAIAVTQDKDATGTSGATIENVFEIAHIVYADIAGEAINHKAEILENSIPGFAISVPVTISASVDNYGDAHERVVVEIAVKNVLTGEQILPTSENHGQYTDLILPDTTRKLEREISALPSIGIVNITQTVYYNGKVSTESTNLIIMPIWLMLLILAFISGIVLLIVRKIKSKKRKRKIIV